MQFSLHENWQAKTPVTAYCTGPSRSRPSSHVRFVWFSFLLLQSWIHTPSSYKTSSFSPKNINKSIKPQVIVTPKPMIFLMKISGISQLMNFHLSNPSSLSAHSHGINVALHFTHQPDGVSALGDGSAGNRNLFHCLVLCLWGFSAQERTSVQGDGHLQGTADQPVCVGFPWIWCAVFVAVSGNICLTMIGDSRIPIGFIFKAITHFRKVFGIKRKFLLCFECISNIFTFPAYKLITKTSVFRVKWD